MVEFELFSGGFCELFGFWPIPNIAFIVLAFFLSTLANEIGYCNNEFAYSSMACEVNEDHTRHDVLMHEKKFIFFCEI